jgi:hypothetical protein
MTQQEINEINEELYNERMMKESEEVLNEEKLAYEEDYNE